MKTPQIAGLAAAGAIAVAVVVGVVLLTSGGGDDDDDGTNDAASNPTQTSSPGTAPTDPPSDEDDSPDETAQEVDVPDPAPAVTTPLVLGHESSGDTATVYIALNRDSTEGSDSSTYGRLIGVASDDPLSYDQLVNTGPADLDVECLVDYTASPGTLIEPCTVEVPRGSTLNIAPGPEFAYTVRDSFIEGPLEFAGWTGCETDAQGLCTIQVDEDMAVVANFRPLANLEIEKRGYPGEVYVSPSSLPRGARCAGQPRVPDDDDLEFPVSGCVLGYPSGTRVTLTAREGLGTLETFLHPGDEGFPASQIPPGEMPKFLGWVGDCEDGTEANVCVLTLSQGNRYEVLALYEFYECPEDSTSAVAYPESQFDTACGDRPAEGPITPDDESIGNRRRQRVCDAPPPAPDDFQVPEHLVATVEMLSAISPELGEAAIDYAATYDPLVTPWVEWFLDPAHELQVRSKPGFRCDGSER